MEQERIHGFRIIQTRRVPTKKPSRIILIDRGEAYASCRYVTAHLFDGDKEWDDGHYITGFKDAAADFEERVARYT